MEFTAFPKIPRLSRECIITEKIDGTNASVFIGDNGEFLTGSRNRWITPDNDNMGFSRWAHEHKDELLLLGPGHHFGEWWGSGIQRRYGLKEKRFSLFNTHRWGKVYQATKEGHETTFPKCCYVVPVVMVGEFSSELVESALAILRLQGSFASPGFTDPEGIVIYHTAANCVFKKTMDDDGRPKSLK